MQQQLVPEGKVAGITDQSHAQELAPPERVVLAYVETLLLRPHDITDELFAELRRHFDDSQIIELSLFALNYYKVHAFNTSVLLEPPDGTNVVRQEHHFGHPRGGDAAALTTRHPDAGFLA